MSEKFLNLTKAARERFDSLSGEVNFTGLATRGNLNVRRRHGQTLTIKTVTSELTLATGGTTSDHASFFPANVVILGVTGRVTVTITGATANLSCGLKDGTNHGEFLKAAGSKLTAGTTFTQLADGDNAATAPSGYVFSWPFITTTAASDLRFTSSSGNFTAGKVRITAWLLSLTAPTIN